MTHESGLFHLNHLDGQSKRTVYIEVAWIEHQGMVVKSLTMLLPQEFDTRSKTYTMVLSESAPLFEKLTGQRYAPPSSSLTPDNPEK